MRWGAGGSEQVVCSRLTLVSRGPAWIELCSSAIRQGSRKAHSSWLSNSSSSAWGDLSTSSIFASAGAPSCSRIEAIAAPPGKPVERVAQADGLFPHRPEVRPGDLAADRECVARHAQLDSRDNLAGEALDARLLAGERWKGLACVVCQGPGEVV